jgi:phage terminase small subunit
MTKKTAKRAAALTARQSRFVDEYLLDLNATQAAGRAGYKDHNIGRKLVAKSHVQAAIEGRKLLRAERTSLDADYVLHRLAEIDQLDVADILDDTGNMLPVRQWPKSWRTSISGLDVNEMMTDDVMTVVKKIKWPDKLKNIELLGKHVSVRAFDTEKESGAEDMAAVLSKMAERLPG